MGSSSDLIKFEETIKNFPISLWIRPIFTIILLIRINFIKLVSLDFILTRDRVISMTSQSRSMNHLLREADEVTSKVEKP